MVRALRLQSLENIDHSDGIVHIFFNIGTKNTGPVLLYRNYELCSMPDSAYFARRSPTPSPHHCLSLHVSYTGYPCLSFVVIEKRFEKNSGLVPSE